MLATSSSNLVPAASSVYSFSFPVIPTEPAGANYQYSYLFNRYVQVNEQYTNLFYLYVQATLLQANPLLINLMRASTTLPYPINPFANFGMAIATPVSPAAASASSSVSVPESTAKKSILLHEFVLLNACTFLKFHEIGQIEVICRFTLKHIRNPLLGGIKTPFSWLKHLNKLNEAVGGWMQGHLEDASPSSQRRWAITLYLTKKLQNRIVDYRSLNKLMDDSDISISLPAFQNRQTLKSSTLPCVSCFASVKIAETATRQYPIHTRCLGETLISQTQARKKFGLTPSQLLSTLPQLKARQKELRKEVTALPPSSQLTVIRKKRKADKELDRTQEKIDNPSLRYTIPHIRIPLGRPTILYLQSDFEGADAKRRKISSEKRS